MLHSEWETYVEAVQYKFIEYMDAEPTDVEAGSMERHTAL